MRPANKNVSSVCFLLPFIFGIENKPLQAHTHKKICFGKNPNIIRKLLILSKDYLIWFTEL